VGKRIKVIEGKLGISAGVAAGLEIDKQFGIDGDKNDKMDFAPIRAEMIGIDGGKHDKVIEKKERLPKEKLVPGTMEHEEYLARSDSPPTVPGWQPYNTRSKPTAADYNTTHNYYGIDKHGNYCVIAYDEFGMRFDLVISR
jgi:hypothetical protein